MIMFTIVLRLLTAYYIYKDATKRGHNTLMTFIWVVASALVPIVGVPLYFLFGRNSKAQKPKEDDGIIDVEATVIQDMMNCGNCGKEIEESLLICPHCRHAVRPG